MHAQTPTPTAEQLELLRSLPPAQRDALLAEYGLVPGSVSGVADAPDFPITSRPRVPEQSASDEEPRISGGETLVISLDLETNEGEALDVTELSLPLQRIAGTRAWQLNSVGELELPNVARVGLAGLSASEIELRLRAEPYLEGLDVAVRILPLSATGADALSYFGYDVFQDVPTTFAPATDVPVPASYVMGPGDTLIVQYFGKENSTLQLPVLRDGSVNVSGIGPVNVAGLTFDDARDQILLRISEQKVGVRATVTIGELRSIQVFVLGDVVRPGSYTVSGLSTITNALFKSGGVKTSGTLRRIEHKRNGRTVGQIDLYDLLLRGDTSKDRRLMPGDVIFVPPVGVRAGIDGEVVRPAYYELRSNTTLSEFLDTAGGLTPNALPQSGRIERVSPRGDRQIIDVDFGAEQSLGQEIRDGDVVQVFPVLDRLSETVELTGYLRRPLRYQWFRGQRLSDVLPSPVLLKPQADLSYVLIRREPKDDGVIEVLSADLTRALAAPGTSDDPLLEPRDTIIAFDMSESRGADLEGVISQLGTQARGGDQLPIVTIDGQVRAPGQYPLESGMRVSDLLRAGGGVTDAAFFGEAELTRYVVGESGRRETRLISIDLGAAISGDSLADELLLPYDFLSIREIPEWRAREAITVLGEVRFPGVYPIKRGETLASVIDRAGGLTPLAFVDGSVFTREALKQREKEQIDASVSRLEADLAALALQGSQLTADAQQAFTFGQSLLAQLRGSEATGRLVIDLGEVVEGQGEPGSDIVLRDGDRLLIPQLTQEVTVIGEVQYATSHLFDVELDRDDYIGRSGGLTGKADGKRIYVVRANGQVIAGSSNNWLRRVGGTDIRPGDTIVVPIDADRIAPLTLWGSVTQIVYNLAIAVAAVNSF